MIKINENFLKLQAGYLFPEIGRRTKAIFLFTIFVSLALVGGCLPSAHQPAKAKEEIDFTFTEILQEKRICNGLSIELRTPSKKVPVASEYQLDVILTNISPNPIMIWTPRFAINLHVVDYNWEGKTVSYFVPHSVGSHDFGVWEDDIAKLAPGEAKTISYTFAHTVPGLLRYKARYLNRAAAVQPEGSRDKYDVWTGKLVSNALTINVCNS